jgi:RNA polymerase sigma-70 factor (ECF subfamily)
MSDKTQGRDVLSLIDQVRQGDHSAREALAGLVYDRLMRLSHLILRSGSARVQRWEETADLAHAAWFRIQRAIESEVLAFTEPEQFFRLAARHIRFEIIDLHRKHRARHDAHRTKIRNADGQLPDDGNMFIENSTVDPKQVALWAEFHETVESLPEPLQEVTDLLWYQGLTQEEAANLLRVSVKTVKRRWRDAKLALADKLDVGILGI